MNPGTGERRLAAIMFTDIVGYTALMAESEEKGLRARERHRQLVRPLVERFHGEAIEARGDESLSVFPSALDAVSCALAIGDALVEEADLKLHVGIHTGDVVVQGGEISGDGVNIASRICALSEGGGLCVSGEVYRSIRNQPDIQSVSLGEQQLKNVGHPVSVYAIGRPGAVAQRRRRSFVRPIAALLALAALLIAVWWSLERADRPLEPIRSIAVLPLRNLSGAPEQDYFADGMTDALIGGLAKIDSLRVLSRSSVMRHKDSERSLTEVARELGADAVVEGSVLRSDGRVRISAQLIDARNEQHLWSESYERDMTDILTLQNEVARAIAARIQHELTPRERARFAPERPVNPIAYEATVKGRQVLYALNPSQHKLSKSYFELAIEHDPNYAPAYAGLADAYT